MSPFAALGLSLAIVLIIAVGIVIGDSITKGQERRSRARRYRDRPKG